MPTVLVSGLSNGTKSTFTCCDFVRNLSAEFLYSSDCSSILFPLIPFPMPPATPKTPIVHLHPVQRVVRLHQGRQVLCLHPVQHLLHRRHHPGRQFLRRHPDWQVPYRHPDFRQRVVFHRQQVLLQQASCFPNQQECLPKPYSCNHQPCSSQPLPVRKLKIRETSFSAVFSEMRLAEVNASVQIW